MKSYVLLLLHHHTNYWHRTNNTQFWPKYHFTVILQNKVPPYLSYGSTPRFTTLRLPSVVTYGLRLPVGFRELIGLRIRYGTERSVPLYYFPFASAGKHSISIHLPPDSPIINHHNKNAFYLYYYYPTHPAFKLDCFWRRNNEWQG